MLSPALRRRPPGDRGRRPQPGDLRLARRLGVQHPQLRRRLPAARRVSAEFPLTVNRRSDRRILEVANRLAAPLLREVPQVAPLEPARVPPTARSRPGSSRPRRRAGLAGRPRSRRRTTGQGRAGSDIGVLTRDNAHAADVFDALTTAGIPVEIVGLKGLLRLPEVAEVVATLHLLTTSPPTPRCSPCSTGRAGRSGRATSSCSAAGRRAGRAGRGGRAGDVVERPRARSPTGRPGRARRR
jgi:DNA helicase-2/ATP-dependent DNA helicase PcrA